jgi:gamma-glutamyltranspeptidase/glutathione hydrolase
MIEAERRAYADRAEHMGDSDFYDVPVAMLTDKDYARQRFLDFDAATASLSSAIGAGAAPLPESPDTTHMSVIDKDGNAVAYTTTLNLSYGSKIVAEGTGILLNNEMDDFSSKEDTPNAYGLIGREANAIEPGKRMLSSMTPTLVTREGEILLATGSPGGSTIITTTMQVVVNVIDHGMTVSDAVGRPRFHHQWLPNRVVFEALGFSPDTLGILEARGHTNLITAPFGLGDANSVMRAGEGYYGMTDPRQAGGAVGVNHVEVR